MSDRVPPIARIRLSRSLPRLLAVPLLGLLAGAAAIAVGLLAAPGVSGVVLTVLGAAVVATALLGAVALLSIRLDVEEAAVGVAWIGGERIYPLSAGPITRVRLRGENASSLRASRWGLGWQLGPAILRGEEPIEVVRLAPSRTAILVPTERGRLAIAAADEPTLLDALSRAARARQRLEQLARETAPELPAPAPEAEPDSALMTGIERAIFERRMAEEAEAAGREATAEPVTDAVPMETVAPTRSRPRLRVPRPRWAHRPGPSVVLLILPLLGAGAAWGAAVLLGRMPEPGTDVGRLTALALVLAGPATLVGAIMARVWWPRLVGVVVAGGLVTSVFVGRALLS